MARAVRAAKRRGNSKDASKKQPQAERTQSRKPIEARRKKHARTVLTEQCGKSYHRTNGDSTEVAVRCEGSKSKETDLRRSKKIRESSPAEYFKRAVKSSHLHTHSLKRRWLLAACCDKRYS